MSKDGHISYEDLNVIYGESMSPGSLFTFTEEENKFRKEIRKFAKEEVDPYVQQIDREDNVDLTLKIVKKLGKK